MVEDLFFFCRKGLFFGFGQQHVLGFGIDFRPIGTFLAKSANIVFQASVFSYSGLPLCIQSSRMQMGHGDDRGADCE